MFGARGVRFGSAVSLGCFLQKKCTDASHGIISAGKTHKTACLNASRLELESEKRHWLSFLRGTSSPAWHHYRGLMLEQKEQLFFWASDLRPPQREAVSFHPDMNPA